MKLCFWLILDLQRAARSWWLFSSLFPNPKSYLSAAWSLAFNSGQD
jgi:hypothetical protein